MKKIVLTFILAAISFVGFSQDTTKYFISKDYGWIWKRGKFDSSLMLPKDTVRNKLGVAQIGSSLYTYGSLRWNLVGGGTVSSIALTTPTGLTTTGSPITTSGTLAVTYTSGYSLPTTASQTLWDAAYTNRITTARYPLIKSNDSIRIDTGRAVNAVATGGALKKIVDSLLSIRPIAIDSPQQVFPSGNIVFTGTTAPSGSTNNTYRWSRSGNVVTVRINISYSVAATAITAVTFTFPSDMPLPENNVTGYQIGADINSPFRANGGNTKQIINPLSAYTIYDTGGIMKLRVGTASQNIQYLQIQGQYFTNN